MKLKSILSIFLSLALSVSMLPAAFADNADTAADTAATEEKQTIVTTADNVRAFMAAEAKGLSINTNSRAGSIGAGSWLRVDGVDFGDGSTIYTAVEVTYGVPDEYAGSTVAVYIDSLDNTPVAQIKLVSTGSWSNLVPRSVPINLTISGIHSVYVKFAGQAACDYYGLKFLSTGGGAGSGSGAWAGTGVEDIAAKLEGLGITGLGNILGPEKIVTNANVLAVARKIYPYFNMSDAEFCGKYGMESSANSTGEDVLNVFRAVAGYDRVSESYSTSFGDLGIFKNVKYTNGSITGKVFLKCIDNFLDSKVLKVGSSSTSFYQSEESVLNACLGIYEEDGIVWSDDYTSIVGGAPGADEVKIGNETYSRNGVDVNGFIGKKVTAYYTDDNNDYSLVYIEALDNKELAVDSDDVEDFSSLTLSYKDASNRSKTARISQDYVLIYNGLVISQFEETLFNSFNGELKLIDNNRDNNYDVLIMTDMTDVLVKAVSGETLYGEDGYVLKLDKKDYVLRDTKGDKMTDAELSTIKKNNVVGVGYVKGADGSELYTLTVSAKTVSGYVTERDVDTYSVVVINGERYEYSKFAKDNSADLVGTEATLYFNAKGKVFFAEVGAKASGFMFGYAEKFHCDEDEEKAYITIFGQDESIIRYECGTNLKIDGKRYKDIKKMSAALKTGFKKGIVTYVTDENGALTEIDFPYNYIGFANPDKYDWEQDNSLFLTYDGSTRYKSDVHGFSGKTLNNNSTIIFFIPSDGEIEDYRVNKISSISHDASYNVKAYGTNVNSYYTQVYEINRNAGATIADNSSTYFVTQVALDSVWDEANEEIYSSIEYFDSGAKTTAKVDPKLNNEIKDLTCGDAIRFATNQDGIISKIEKRYDVETGTVNPNDPSSTSTAFQQPVRVLEERVRTIYDGVALLDGIEEIADLNVSNIVIYDSSKTGTKRLEAAKASDIIPGEKIFIAQYYGNVKGVMILR